MFSNSGFFLVSNLYENQLLLEEADWNVGHKWATQKDGKLAMKELQSIWRWQDGTVYSDNAEYALSNIWGNKS